jgi:hypothetical protein
LLALRYSDRGNGTTAARSDSARNGAGSMRAFITLRAVDAPRLTVIVPMHDNAGQLELCLAALRASPVAFELVVVDDASRDAKAIEVAKGVADVYHRLERNAGPAVARNAGAKLARGEILAFVDSDVVVARDTLAELVRALDEDRGAAAVFGAYDDAPASPGLVTEYRNLLHHYVHLTGPSEATTFWAGCGAIRRAAFERIRGFDESFRRPSIEDIELGMRLKAAGERILLRPGIRCKHLKHWRLADMIVVDVTRRAIPWTKLLIERPGTGGDLNLQPAQKLCVALVFLAVIAFALGVALPQLSARFAWAWLPAALLAPVAWINRGLYALFLRRKGALFALGGFLLHQLYYVYGGVAFLYAQARYRIPRRAAKAGA